MIKIEARIKLFDSDDGTVTDATINNANNISSGSFGQSQNSIIGREVKQSQPFLLDNSPLVGGEDYEIAKNSDMYVLADRVNYFIGSLVSGDDGTFPNGASYSITINGADFNAITIVFDKDDEVWPTEVVINGKSYINDDPIFTVGGLGGTVDELEVTISKLNKPNKGLIVTGIYVDITIVVDEKNLDSFTYSLYDRASNDEPSYGVVSNSGTLSFVDSTGEILDYITNRMLTNELSVNVSISNTLNDKKELFISAKTSQWEYDNNNFITTVSISDQLQDLQNYTYVGFPYDKTFLLARDIYDDIISAIPTSFGFPTFDMLPENIRNKLAYASVTNPYMENCSVWEALDGFCKTFGLRIYKEKSNIMVEVQ